MPRSATAASIRTGSTRFGLISSRCSISCTAAATAADPPALGHNNRAARLQTFLGRPAIVAAVAIAGRGESQRTTIADAPVVLSVKFIDDDVLAEIASRLQLRNLRKLDKPAAAGDYVFDLNDQQGNPLAQFAWTPKRPGAEIVNSVVPFIAIALAGFALLAGLVLRHMRRTAATIAAGENRLRHLALHDPLCGLPNRIFFGERLEAAIEKVRQGAPAAAVFYIDLDHFKDVNDTLGHPVGDELIRRVTQRLSRTLRGDDMVARLGGDEFAVITAAGSDHVALQAIANRIIASLCAPYAIDDQTIVIGASIGIAVDPRASSAARPTSCATPTWRSIAPRTRAATAPASTTPRWTPTWSSAS